MVAIVLLVATGCSETRRENGHGPAPTAAPTTTTSAVTTTIALPAAASCRDAVQSSDPLVLVAAFRAARIAGRGAEGCLTREGLASYSDAGCTDEELAKAPGPVILYRCAYHRVMEIHVTPYVRVPTDVNLSVTLSGGAESVVISENLTIGRGVPVGDRVEVPQVVTEAAA